MEASSECIYISLYITEHGDLGFEVNVFTEDSMNDMIHH